jgi:hypothetical protein
LTNKPYAPAHLVFIGIVTRINANNGEIFVKVQNGFELREIHDVDLITTTPINGHILGYDGTLWVNKTIAGWLGFTPVPTSRTLTINGVTYDLSANRSWTISGGGGGTTVNARTEYEYTTDGSTATYTAAYTVGQVDVFYNGAKLSDTEFTATNGTSITLGFTPVIGQLVEVVAWLGMSAVASTRTLTINGTTYDLSADRSWTINSMVYPSAGIAVSTGTDWGTSITDNSTNWNTAYTNRITSLTTTGSSGSATLVANTLNIPTYTLAGLGGQAALNGTGFVKISGTTISYDNSTYYLASNPSGFIVLASLSAGTGISYNNTTGAISSTITQYTDALARASITDTITGIDYNTTTGVLSTTDGYGIPTTTSQTNWDTAYTNRITSLTTTGTSGAATLVGNVLNIPQYSGGGGGGMAIGGTITSATAGSVLFAGVSGVLAQDNANFFWDDTNNRLGIGSTTLGSSLQVNGNAAIGYSASTAAPTNGLAVAGTSTFGDNLTVSKNHNAGTNIIISNTTSGNSADVALLFASDASSGSCQVFKYNSTKTAYKVVNPSDFGHYNVGAGNIVFFNDFGSGAITFTAGGSSTAHLTLNSSGNLGLATATIGSKFQVNGNAAIGYSASTAAPTNGLAVSGAATIQTLTIGLGNSSVATNTAIGFQALNANTSGAGQTAVGYQAMNGQLATGTTTDPNVAVGYQAMLTNTGGSNTAIGGNAMRSGTNSYNTTVGSNSMRNITSGGSNTALGQGAMQNVSTGSSNSAFGNVALLSIGTGSNNMAFGQNAFVNLANVSNNIAIGCNAARFTGSGTTPTTSNTNSIYIGFDVRPQSSSTTNEIIISGYNGTAPIVGNGSNTTLIGNSATTATYLYGAITTPSSVTATSFIKSGGTSAQYLMADGSVTTGTGGAATMSIGSSITSATAGSILFVGAGGVLAEDNAGFFFDVANDRLGIGTATPTARLQVSGSTTASSGNALSTVINPTLVAAANSDRLIALDVNPTFTTGTFTGLSSLAARFNGNVVIGTIPTNISAFTYPPLTLANNATGATKVQLSLVNGGGSAGAGSAIDFYTYTDAGNGNPGVRIVSTDDGVFSGNFQIQTKAQGGSGTGALSTKFTIVGGSGNVGIGTTTPIRLLSLGSTFGATAGLSTNVKIALYDDGVSNNVYGLGISGGMLEIQSGQDTAFYNGTLATRTERMRIASGGSVGIGTTTIGSTLQINGNAAIGYSASTAAPTNGLSISGNLAVGLTTTTAAQVDILSSNTVLQATGSGLSTTTFILKNTNASYSNSLFYGFTTRTSNSAFKLLDLRTNNGSTVVFTVDGNGTIVSASTVTATSFIRTGGLSTQYLMADGSVTTGGGGGSVTLSAIGSTPNANGATLTGSALNLEPASASFGGVVTTGVQTFAGAKTFNSSVTAGSFIKSGGLSTQYLMADGSVTTGTGGTVSMTIGGSITGSTVGSILFVGTSGVLEQDNANLFWDDTNNNLLINGGATVTGVLNQTVTTNRQTASYTLVLADRGKLVEMNVATANNLTVPLNSTVAFPIGTQIDIAQYGAGQTTVLATVGVTIRSTNNWVKLNARYGAATLIKIATDEWYLFGNLNA